MTLSLEAEKLLGIKTGQSGLYGSNVSKKMCGRWCIVCMRIGEKSQSGLTIWARVVSSSQSSFTAFTRGISSRKAAILAPNYEISFKSAGY